MQTQPNARVCFKAAKVSIWPRNPHLDLHLSLLTTFDPHSSPAGSPFTHRLSKAICSNVKPCGCLLASFDTHCSLNVSLLILRDSPKIRSYILAQTFLPPKSPLLCSCPLGGFLRWRFRCLFGFQWAYLCHCWTLDPLPCWPLVSLKLSWLFRSSLIWVSL